MIDVEQGSPEWFAARAGRLTGSVAHAMLAEGKGVTRNNLRAKLVLERLTGKPHDDDYVSKAMQAGKDREPDARAAYEVLTGNLVTSSGFLSHTELMAGCSLDGYIGDYERLMSIKCRQPPAHFECVKTRKVPSQAMKQIRHELWLTGAEEHDYFSFNPDFPESRRAVLVTVHRRDCNLDEYDALARAFLSEVDAEVEAFMTTGDLRGQLERALA